jgi:hypothetical protein
MRSAQLGRRRALISTIRTALLAFPCLLVLAACSQQALLEKFSSSDDRALGTRLIESVQAGDPRLVASLVPPDRSKQAIALVPEMQKIVPSGPGSRIRLIDARFTIQASPTAGSIRNVFLAYEVDKASRHALVRIGLTHRAKATVLTDFYVNPLAKPIEQLAAFGLTGKSAVQYLFLGLAILFSLTCVAAFVAVIRSKGVVKHRWVWALLCLFSFSRFAVDWTTGAVNVQPLSIQLFGGFAFQSGMLNPWQVGFGLPLFALAFLWPGFGKRKEAVRPRPLDLQA